MKKVLVTTMMLAMTMAVMAVPAKKGMWKTITLADGSELRATLVGDEHGHFWKAENGQAYSMQNGVYVAIDAQQRMEQAKARRAKVNARRVQKREFGHPTTITGNKKAIMILVNFNDVKYQASHTNALFQKIANEENYTEGKFQGSMADYFKAQSRGKFTLDFDVVGPVTVSKNASYYGSNDSQENDMYPEKMVQEAVTLAKNQISDWTPYDWDNDGYVDQVYVVYAGKGEADGGAENTIWPHAWELGSSSVTVGTNLKVNSYACGPELDGQTGDITGIGTMCHEYSHCLGYPDFYDIDYSGGQGMGEWDLMDAGSYNGDSYQPAGYTSYERWFAGWETPVVLGAEDLNVTDMKSLQNGGEFYIIYNDKNANEYYLLENRQFEGWDASLPASGLLIIHCDYNASVWEQNGPNDDPAHQRMTVVPADGAYTYEVWQGNKYYDPAEPFPYNNVTAFNKNFKTKDTQAKKAAQFFTKTSNGTYWMNGSVENIAQNNSLVSFDYVADAGSQGGGTPVEGDFYESFDQCNGTGGNDGSWSGSIASAGFIPDNDGWTVASDKSYGADQCAKFGVSPSNKKPVAGSATTPDITLNGTATLTFKAGAWEANGDGTTLTVAVEGGSIDKSSFTMVKGAFTDYTANVTGNGSIQINFSTNKGRFFLDEVLLKSPTTGIMNVHETATAKTGVYTLDGRYLGTDFSALKPGLYIVNGKKVIR